MDTIDKNFLPTIFSQTRVVHYHDTVFHNYTGLQLAIDQEQQQWFGSICKPTIVKAHEGYHHPSMKMMAIQ